MIVDKSETQVVLRFDSRTRRDERMEEITRQINSALTPELCADFHLLMDESTLDSAINEGDHVPFEHMYRDSIHLPRVTPAQIDAARRYSQRMIALERAAGETRAREQPRYAEIDEVLQTIEAELAVPSYR